MTRDEVQDRFDRLADEWFDAKQAGRAPRAGLLRDLTDLSVELDRLKVTREEAFAVGPRMYSNWVVPREPMRWEDRP